MRFISLLASAVVAAAALAQIPAEAPEQIASVPDSLDQAAATSLDSLATDSLEAPAMSRTEWLKAIRARVDSLRANGLPVDSLTLDSLPHYESLTDSLMSEAIVTDTVMSLKPLSRQFFLPAVYDKYVILDTLDVFKPTYSGNPAMRWVEEALAEQDRTQRVYQSAAILNPGSIPYNLQFLPDAPKEYTVTVNPEDHTITINELATEKVTAPTITVEAVKRKHWIKTFNASLQFSQAFVSPNWYQGGNNNINSLLNIYYNVKLNQTFHPKLLFENTFQYKLGMNSAPDDTIRSYNVSEDILQINSVFGYKAAKRWYYSVTGQFKTQVVNSYKSNTNTMRSAFLSPAELNLGIGMTYNYANPKKTFTFDASLAPLSYNMIICTNNNINPGNFGIEEGKKTTSHFGSSAECKIMWKIAYNIQLNSRIFCFTDYSRTYADWENTVVFEINKYLTSQLFLNFRYDTDTPEVPDQSWKKLQMKEIISLGFSYRFSTL